jgi:hypothetical protein
MATIELTYSWKDKPLCRDVRAKRKTRGRVLCELPVEGPEHLLVGGHVGRDARGRYHFWT